MKFLLILFLVVLTGCATTSTTTQASIPRSEKDIILHKAAEYGIPREVILHVAKKESGFRCKPGNPRYHGPLQVSKQSAKALGYKDSEGSLNSCNAGLKYGLRHLKLCVNKVGNNPKKAAACHAMPGKYGVRVNWK